jgi:hypothetical protein
MNMKATLAGTAQRFVALTTLSLALTACGNKSNDPLKGYEELSNRIPVGEKKQLAQQHIVCGNAIKAEKLVVVEGQTASQKVTIVGPSAKSVGSFVFEETIAGASLSKVKQTKIQDDKKETPKVDESQYEQEYKLSYKAARGTVPYNLPAKLISTTIAPKDQVGQKEVCSLPLDVEVHKIVGIPSIISLDAPTSLKYEAIGDIEVSINVQAARVPKVEDLTLSVGFDESRQSNENPIINLKDLKPEVSGTIAVATDSYKYTYKIKGDALRAALDKQSAVLAKAGKTQMFVDFHATFKVSNSHTKEKSLTHDYILRIDRKPIEVAASPAAAPGVK